MKIKIYTLIVDGIEKYNCNDHASVLNVEKSYTKRKCKTDIIHKELDLEFSIEIRKALLFDMIELIDDYTECKAFCDSYR